MEAKLTAALDAMPSGLIQYFGMESSKYLTSLGNFMFGVAFSSDEKEAKTVQAAIDELIQSRPGTRLEAYNPLPMQGLQVLHFKDPVKAARARLKLIGTLASGSTYNDGILKDKPIITPKAKKYGDFEFTGVELTRDLERMAENKSNVAIPDETKKKMVENFKKTFGPKLMSWIGTDGKATVQVTAKDWSMAEKLLDSYFKGQDTVANLAAYQDVRKELPAEASMIALMELVRAIGGAFDFAKPVFESVALSPDGLPSMPAKVTPTYVGMAATLKSEHGSFDLFISSATMRELYKAYTTLAPNKAKRGGAK